MPPESLGPKSPRPVGTGLPRTLGLLLETLPYDVRRRAAAILVPRRFRALQARRHVITGTGYTYEPFDRYRCIFVHVPKAAGISVARALFGNLGGGHNPIAVYRYVFSEAEFQSYFKFTFVRNPWDRTLSAFRFLTGGGMDPADRAWSESHLAAYADFSDFVVRGLRKPQVISYDHFIPQHEFVCLPYGGEIAVDFVGHFESLAADFERVKKRLGVGHDVALPRENATPGKPVSDYRSFYNSETKEIVSEVYRKDIELFGYTFDPQSDPHPR